MFWLLQHLVRCGAPSGPHPSQFPSSFWFPGSSCRNPDNSTGSLSSCLASFTGTAAQYPVLQRHPCSRALEWSSSLGRSSLPRSPVSRGWLLLSAPQPASCPLMEPSHILPHGVRISTLGHEAGQGRLSQSCPFFGHSASAWGIASAAPVFAISVFFSN